MAHSLSEDASLPAAWLKTALQICTRSTKSNGLPSDEAMIGIALCSCGYGTCMWHVRDAQGRAADRSSHQAKQLFDGLDTDANGRLEIEDFRFLEKQLC